MPNTTHIGIMPLTTANYGQLYSRNHVYIETPTLVQPIPGVKILLNINHDPRQPFEFSKDMVWYKEQLLKIPLSTLNPKLIAIENEELHDPFKDINDYCEELKTAVGTLPNYRITNGGFTLPLHYWYVKQQPSDLEFLNLCVPLSSQGALRIGLLDERITSVQTELDVLKSLPIEFWNLHYYLRNVGEVAPMVRMIQYVSNYVGKPCISNECGIYNSALLNDVVSVAKQTNMKFCILYNGEGIEGVTPPVALSISREQFQQIQQTTI